MSDQLFNDLKEDFCFAYKWLKKKPYVWNDAKDNKALGLLISKLREYHKSKGKVLNTEEMKIEVRKFYNSAVTSAPNWIKASLEMSLISSKFNLIVDCEGIEKASGYYDKYKHEFIDRPMTKGQVINLSDILTSFIQKTDGKNEV